MSHYLKVIQREKLTYFTALAIPRATRAATADDHDYNADYGRKSDAQ